MTTHRIGGLIDIVVIEGHLDLGGVFDDMVVCYDIAVRPDDYAGAASLPLTSLALRILVTEEKPEERVVRI